MHAKIARTVMLTAALVGLRTASAADAPDARLREALKSATAQLASAESDRAAAQAAAADAEQAKAKLVQQLTADGKQSAADRAAAAQAADAAAARIAVLQEESRRLQAAMDQAKAENRRLAAALQQAQGQLAESSSSGIVLERKVEDLHAKNVALCQLGKEILNRYEKFSLGEALAAKEPFVGRSRVKLENLVQDYDDRLDAQRSP